jgi:hypothetical protein
VSYGLPFSFSTHNDAATTSEHAAKRRAESIDVQVEPFGCSVRSPVSHASVVRRERTAAFRGTIVLVRSPRRHAAATIALLAGACGEPGRTPVPPPASPPPLAPPPGNVAPSPPPAAAAGDRACCVPSGVDDPADDSYRRCVAAGGRRWGTDGCGQNPDGSTQAAPPSAEP